MRLKTINNNDDEEGERDEPIDNIELNYAIEYSLSIPATIKCFVSDTHMQVNALL